MASTELNLSRRRIYIMSVCRDACSKETETRQNKVLILRMAPLGKSEKIDRRRYEIVLGTRLEQDSREQNLREIRRATAKDQKRQTASGQTGRQGNSIRPFPEHENAEKRCEM
jgi:hypothetical protein